MPLRSCYCGQSPVLAPRIFGRCCEDTPPVQIPGGCRWCGTDLCEVGNPLQLPDNSSWHYDVPARFPDYDTRLGAWVHAGCIDEYWLSRGREDIVTGRRQDRVMPVGEIAPLYRRVFG
jgi:hypothetical protein